MGVAEGGDSRVDYNMVHLKHTPPNYQHLSGLLDLFKAKLVRTIRVATATVDPVAMAMVDSVAMAMVDHVGMAILMCL